MSDFTVHKIIEGESVFVHDLPLCQVRLQNQRKVGWLILLPRLAGAREIFELSAEDRTRLMEEITVASKAVHQFFKPFKINVASLGNIVPQIHVHVVGRYDNDPAWPGPVWGRLEPEAYGAAELESTVAKIKTLLSAG